MSYKALFLFLICGIVLGIAGNNLWHQYQSEPKLSSKNQSCAGMNIIDSSNCVYDEVSKFYKYNITNRHKDLTDEELKTEGGVCWQYSNYYSERMKALGFYVTEPDIVMNSVDSHTFAVASMNSTYCILDQSTKPYCWIGGQ